ncbi:hypothetical protein PC9H_010259 [Pleurotus ostreatus]|uniref:Uncharacterized protein n=1 Tax=Pleurotus ostreatus TaxID=5322 RepID=A0A8H7DRE6_PLEOS|nr:uncharacterized protein PC9H_011229 [Pleurotus ostreatus]XP_036629142.1 uncharacterized protein PC9H_010259 [Pleurotus ostreatus]KAF7423065.1 hypothetical protein PC9H_011229 [Pleurotus ostreatus]KAF7424948.1 hypothetical protein PC9H_010259 [Pleurotus ostreatus]
MYESEDDNPAFVEGHLDTVCNIAIQILEQKAFCQQYPDQDGAEEAPEDQAEYDSVLISSAGYLVAALVNALGTDIAQAFEKFFLLIAKYYLSATPEAEVLSNAAFAAGLLIESSDIDLSQQHLHLLGALQPLFVLAPDAPAGKLNARDNAAGAIGRTIIRNTAAIPLGQVLPVFIDALPLKNDYLENRPVFRR